MAPKRMASGGPGHARRPPSAADVRDENGHESGAHARCARRHSQARRWCGGGPATFAFFCLGALPRMAGVQWDRASPFSVSAKGGDLLTITGAFETSATYECEFSPLEIGSSTVTSAAFAPEDSTKVVCTTPQWDRAAQRTRLRVLDQGTTQPIAGPGDPAAIITFTASWTRGKVDGSTSEGNAVGGNLLTVTGEDKAPLSCLRAPHSQPPNHSQRGRAQWWPPVKFAPGFAPSPSVPGYL